MSLLEGLHIPKALKNNDELLENFSKATDFSKPKSEREFYLKKSLKNSINTIPDNIMPETKQQLKEDFDLDDNPKIKENNNGAQKYMQLFDKHHRPELNVLFKPEKDITEAEILAASKFSNYESKDYALNDRVQKKVKGWYEQNYGTQPVRRDATGRQIDPEPKFKLPEQEIPVRTKDGSVMEEGLSNLARKMAEIDADETPDTGVSALQKSLNRLGYAPELKEDGKLGPKTSLQTRAYLAENGFGRILQALNRKVYL